MRCIVFAVNILGITLSVLAMNTSTVPPNIWITNSGDSDLQLLSEHPNSNIFLPKKSFSRVTLVCSAPYPIKWEYLYQNTSLPILETDYHRLSQSLTDKSNNTFITTVNLRGLQEYQSGKYVCRHFNRRLEHNSYNLSSYFNLFISGKHDINEVNHISYVSKSESAVVVRCPVTNPDVTIRLSKFNDHLFNRTKEIRWRSIYPMYDATVGFILLAGLGRDLFGTYNCSTSTGQSIISVIAQKDEKEHYNGIWDSKNCFGDVDFLDLVRSKRLECYCKNSYALFLNEDFKRENRKAMCEDWKIPANCSSDWRVQQFFDNGEDSNQSCYYHKRPFNGTGSRAEMMASKLEFQEDDEWKTNISVIFNGFESWATGAVLAIRRKSHNITDLEIIRDSEPSFQTHFPLAQNRAGWTNITVSGNDIISVHVFQPDSLSYDWFQLSTDVFQNFQEMENNTATLTHGMEVNNSSSQSLSLFTIAIITLLTIATQKFIF